MISRRDFLRILGLTTATSLAGWKYPAWAKVRPQCLRGEYDAVIIGAGLGGLGCAAYMAQNGFKPLVIEQHSVPGGYASSFTRVAEGKTFTCEVSLHGTAATANQKMYEDLGVLDKLTFIPHAETWYSIFPDFTFEVPLCGGNLNCFKDILIEKFPEEESGISEYMSYWQNIVAELENYYQATLIQLLMFPFIFPTLWDVREKTLAEVQNEYISDEKLKAILSQSCGYYGLPPSKLSAFYYLFPQGTYHMYGSYNIKGTSQSLSNALVDVIEDAGGEVILGTKVTEILTSFNRARGVKTEDGESYYANAIVSNAAAPQTFGDLLPETDVPKDYMDKLSSYEPSLSSFNVWLGLNQDITNTISRADFSVYPGYDFEKEHEGKLEGDPEKSGFGLFIYDNLDKDFSPEGCSTISIMFLCGYDPWKQFETDYFAGNKDAYYEEKNRITEKLISLAEEYVLPGLSEMIIMKESATPLTNVRYTANTRGAIYGYDQTIDNSFMNRISIRTPVRRLYLAGSWSNPGGGYTGALGGGIDTAKAMWNDLFWLF